MSQYNNQYYIVFENYDENTLYLKPQKHSAMRDYEYTKLSGGEPMFFENCYRDEDLARRVSRPIKQAHLDSTYPVFSDEIKQSLGNVDNACCQIYPSVIVDDHDKYHEGYWVFNVFEKMDVLDMDKCAIRKRNPNREGQKIQKYCLSDEKLEEVPEKDRLIFMPKFSSYPHIIVHEKIVKAFKKHNVDTLNFVKVSDWVMGLQFVES
ncbi:imm11 family protein [Vibrio maritimus]